MVPIKVLSLALLVATSVAGAQLISADDMSAVKPRAQANSSGEITIKVNGQKVKVKKGEPLNIEWEEGGKKKSFTFSLDGPMKLEGLHLMPDHAKVAPLHSFSFTMPDMPVAPLAPFGPDGKMDPKALAEFEASMDEFKSHMKELKLHFKELAAVEGTTAPEAKLDAKSMAEFKAAMEQFRSQMKQFHLQYKNMAVDGEKIHAEVEKALKEGMAAKAQSENLRWASKRSDELIKSLTADQLAKMKSRGYLLPADLTKEQLALLPGLGEGKKWTISMSKDGQKFEFRSNP